MLGSILKYGIYSIKLSGKFTRLKWTPSQGQFFLWVKVYFCLSFSSLIMLPFWQHLFPNKSLQVFFFVDVKQQRNLLNWKSLVWSSILKWTPSQGHFLSWVKVYFCLFFIVLFTLPSWQLLFPKKSLQAFFLPKIDVASQNYKTKNIIKKWCK